MTTMTTTTQDFVDTSIFQGVVEFRADGDSFRAHRTGERRGRGGKGTYEIFRLIDGAYIRRGEVKVPGGKLADLPRRLHSAYERMEYED